MSHDVKRFSASNGAKDLVETCINDLRMLSKNISHREQDAPEKREYIRPRRSAIIILYATGEVSVTEGWSLDGGDFKSSELLEKLP